jgi:hypothetical protein
MVLKSDEGGEEVVDLLLRSKTSSMEKKTKEGGRLAGTRQRRESHRLDVADPHQGNGEEAEGGTPPTRWQLTTSPPMVTQR